ncbi:MAG TPA: glucosidase [Thermoanaerobaculia bacterium]|nr:glucosidase [Thermoanaerobaculia bacterium]
MTPPNAERLRLSGSPEQLAAWRKWGPYVADRAWGTVREDYSAGGDAWNYLPHDLARSKAFRWGEDGIAGFCDRYQILVWSLALWNERDPILKERFFGLTPHEGNHGEDVKEYYFHLDALPSHAWQRMLYKYPQREYPYRLLIDANRDRHDPGEIELLDTGIFDDDRYFDIVIEIAKASPDDMHFRVTATNRGPDAAPLHLLPQLTFRNVWSWGSEPRPSPRISTKSLESGEVALLADDSIAPPLPGLLADTRLGPMRFDFSAGATLLFTDNETNGERVFGPGAHSKSPHTKDAFHRRVVGRETAATSQTPSGTKAAAWWRFVVEPGESVTVAMRLASNDTHRSSSSSEALADGESVLALRRVEADTFYDTIHPPEASDEEKSVQRQALAGMLWSKQIYLFDVDAWLEGDRADWPPPESRKEGRNQHWRHLNSMRILSMPDTWEYPWFAAWDLAFHAVPLALVDGELAKEQLWLLLFEQFQHPNGQIPAYEWEFSDLNPPVHAWAVWRVYNMDRIRSGRADRPFLERCFHKLLLNFTWWVNKVDRAGHNVFEGGFLGLDNITVVDRSNPLPGGASLEQSDGTGWMGMFSLVMMRIALELARENFVYEGLATKFFEHYVYIGAAMKMPRDGRTLWDEDDGFFYDLLRLPDGSATSFRVRSLVGLIPLYAIERLEEQWIRPFPIFAENLRWFLENRRDIVERCVTTVEDEHGVTHVLAVVDHQQLERLLARVVDPNEFLSPHGLRSLSKHHRLEPFRFDSAEVAYEPAEARVKIKGGNSNWRGPVWFPTTFLMIESLRKLEKAFGGKVQVMSTDPDTGERALLTLTGIAGNLADRMIGIFVRDDDGYRPLYGPRGTRKSERFAHDPHWKNLLLFHEYFNGDSGEGLGANHQTGWTGLVASLIDEWRRGGGG